MVLRLEGSFRKVAMLRKQLRSLGHECERFMNSVIVWLRPKSELL